MGTTIHTYMVTHFQGFIQILL